jgi:hypothetical protein
MTLLGFKTILHTKCTCRSGKNSEGPVENSWVLDLCPAKWKQISKSLHIYGYKLCSSSRRLSAGPMSSKMKTNFKKSAYLWVQTVLLLSPTNSFIRTRQTLYRGSSRKTTTASPILYYHVPLYRWIISKFGHLFHWAFDTTDTARSASYFDIHLKIKVKNETLRQMRWFTFSHCEAYIYM